MPGIHSISEVLDRSLTHSGHNLVELSAASTILLVFLRHTGCTFCREALQDIARSRSAIEQGGVRMVLVHMGAAGTFHKLLLRYGLAGMDCIRDPSRELYRAFGLKRGTCTQLFGLKVLLRGLLEGVLFRNGAGPVTAGWSQMPGVFLIGDSAILRRFRHLTAADRPDYAKFCMPDSKPAAES